MYSGQIHVKVGGKLGGRKMAENRIRNPRKALTARLVDSALGPGKYFDGNGLFLKVHPNGSRQWIQRITIRGKRRELGLGSPPAVPLVKAREMALENRGEAMLGGDPLQRKREAARVLTFTQAVEEYLASKLDEFKNEKHKAQWQSTLDTYAKPVLGPKKVSQITVQDVLLVLQPIWAGKTETASRLRGRIEAVLSWATAAGHRSGDNPARWAGNLKELLPKPSKVANADNHPALALGDVSRWWKALGEREGMAAQALRFQTLCASRSGEVRGMTWAEIEKSKSTPATSATLRHGVPALSDSDGADSQISRDTPATSATSATWTIPASRMKAGREHRVPLTLVALELLERLPRMKGSPYVFSAPRGGMLSDMTLSAVMRRMHEDDVKSGGEGFLDPRSKRPAVPHGLRATFRQWAAERGHDRDMAEMALAHSVATEVERAYQRSDMLERRRAMMAAWASFLHGTEGAAGNVVVLEMVR